MPDFKFRLPSINELTDAQKVAFYVKKSLLVTGGPGSGKTVVSIFRYLGQISDNRNAMFFTYNRTLMAAIRGTLRQKADILFPELEESIIEKLLANNIGSIFEWYGSNFHVMLSNETGDSIADNFKQYIATKKRNVKYSELFIDESQDLHPEIISNVFSLADRTTCGADRSQDIQGKYTGPADDIIYNLLKAQSETIRQQLSLNFRNTKEIFQFARQFVPEDISVQNLDVNELNDGETPDIRGGLNEVQQQKIILQIVEQNPNSNIGIIVHTRPQIMSLKELFERNGYSCNLNSNSGRSFSYYCSGMDSNDRQFVETNLQSPFILTYESCKGLEFDIVIMPFFEKSDWALNNYKPNNMKPELDALGKPKAWATKNHYYVAATRARGQLFVLFDNKPEVLGFWNENRQANLFDNVTMNLPF